MYAVDLQMFNRYSNTILMKFDKFPEMHGVKCHFLNTKKCGKGQNIFTPITIQERCLARFFVSRNVYFNFFFFWYWGLQGIETPLGLELIKE